MLRADQVRVGGRRFNGKEQERRSRTISRRWVERHRGEDIGKNNMNDAKGEMALGGETRRTDEEINNAIENERSIVK